MPTPFQILLDPVTLTLISLYLALIVWEAVAPARDLPKSPVWRLRGFVAFAAFILLSAYLPWLWSGVLVPLRVFEFSGLETWQGAALGVLVYEAGAWVYHRSLHRSDFLWRWLHQWHHSAERHDAYGAFWFSPLDIAGWTALSSLALTVIIGLTPQATFAATCVLTFLTIFQHTNVRTPQWLGFIVQRPESHSWHHARGEHASNYSDLPLFDLLFGTFRNPRDFAPEQGFYDGASLRLLDMLRGRDLASAVSPKPVGSTADRLNPTIDAG